MYETSHNVTLTIDGEVPRFLPTPARPSCKTCDKPTLDPSNYEVIAAYNLLHGHAQQVINMADGKRLGMRVEAMYAVVNELCAAGEIRDRDLVLRRLPAIDDAVNRAINDRIDAEASLRRHKNEG